MAATKLISLENLTSYHGLIKTYIDNADALAIKRISYNSSTRVVSFFKTAEAPTTGEDTPYTTITLPSTSEFIEKLTVVASGETGNHAGDFVVLDANGALVGAGDTIAAEKITIADAGSLITATNVEDALQELATASAGGVSSKTIYITETAGTSADSYSKRYGIYQGSTGNSSSPAVGEKITDIDIPKDMVVSSGSVVDITYDSTEGKLYDGVTDVTTAIKGSGTASATDAGKYIKLVIANATSDTIYIKASDLVDVYTAEQNATQVQLAIDANNEISATIVAASISATELASDSVTTAKIVDENVTLGKLSSGVQASLALADSAIQEADMTADNVVYTAADNSDPENPIPETTVADALDDIYSQIGAGGSVSDQISDAIDGLDSTTSDLGVTATSGSVMNAITGLSITDGLISAYDYTTLGSAALQADTYFMKSADYAIAESTDISGLFSA